MAESIIQVTEGSGKKLQTYERTIGANDVHAQQIITAMPAYATYRISNIGALSAATADSHIFQIMAGASLPVYVRRIRLFMATAATSATAASIALYRLSTAGTGGGALTPALLDTTQSAAGATAMTLPSSKGTETTLVDSFVRVYTNTLTTTSAYPGTELILDERWGDAYSKGLRIPAGTSNGIAIKHRTAVAGATVFLDVEIIEAQF